jgi:glycosyltransferase involved in cell wall biosynthesis
MNIIITMSTYNGDRFLRDQLDSILAQILPATTIIIRDDGSSDTTRTILQEYASRHSNIQLIQDDLGNIGIQRSYSKLLAKALSYNPDYLLYSDQDDFWLPEKIALLVEKIKPLDQPNKPALVFSDAKVVDENLQVIHPSLTALQKLDMPDADRLKALLFYCPALGCTMIFNKKLATLIATMPSENSIQDKWTLIFALVLGNIDYLPIATVLHRQHQRNATGALFGIKRKIISLNTISFLQQRYQTAVDQALELKRSIPDLPEKDKQTLDQFILLFTGNYFQRMANYWRFCITPPHWKRKMGLFFSLFFTYRLREIK